MTVKMFLDSPSKADLAQFKDVRNQQQKTREKIQNNYESGAQTKRVAQLSDY